ncbi:TetR/AcrR family transcriptional regulator [Streptomyces sp. B-S-A8]|uniref:TetR/AcrR family transcriptional regulator n=1 Tax=Streptomyces solicavernae TaxID=3043614 RepID=A0ABT6RTA4_9ACTN|nr:TetR/AcrR family transcriptional regulator [Streptomyces sp. B-S-A8]MDI3387622.1 TetR/AcrR family transcriptional regulator [Streptomyces sp. B-S-A8]
MSPKQKRGEATVEQVLDAALRIYAASGEGGLTVEAVTRTSGVSSGSVYHHFGSMHGVVLALAQRWLGQLLGELVTALTQAPGPRAAVDGIVRAYLAFVRRNPDAARLLHSATADQNVMADIESVRDSQEARLSPVAEWIDARVAAGELAALPAPLIEALILGPVVAVARRWLTLGDVDLDVATESLPERIWQSVSP